MLTAAAQILPLNQLELQPLQIWIARYSLDPDKHKYTLVTITRVSILRICRQHIFLMAGSVWQPPERNPFHNNSTIDMSHTEMSIPQVSITKGSSSIGSTQLSTQVPVETAA